MGDLLILEKLLTDTPHHHRSCTQPDGWSKMPFLIILAGHQQLSMKDKYFKGASGATITVVPIVTLINKISKQEMWYW